MGSETYISAANVLGLGTREYCKITTVRGSKLQQSRTLPGQDNFTMAHATGVLAGVQNVSLSESSLPQIFGALTLHTRPFVALIANPALARPL